MEANCDNIRVAGLSAISTTAGMIYLIACLCFFRVSVLGVLVTTGGVITEDKNELNKEKDFAR